MFQGIQRVPFGAVRDITGNLLPEFHVLGSDRCGGKQKVWLLVLAHLRK